jgi:hypothetical protein
MANSGHSYQVASQLVNQTVPDAAGNVIVGSYIYFLTGDGNTGVIFVPDNLLTEAHVKQELQAATRKLDRIGRLAESFS